MAVFHYRLTIFTLPHFILYYYYYRCVVTLWKNLQMVFFIYILIKGLFVAVHLLCCGDEGAERM